MSEELVRKKPIFNFGSRTALITGGTGNIGLSIAQHLLMAGMKVAVIGSRESSRALANRTLEAVGGNYNVWLCDLKDRKSVKATISEIFDFFGSIDVLVNCAGVLETSELEDIDEVLWDQVLDVNLKATFFVTQTCIPHLKNGSNPRVINISSNAGRMGGIASGAAYAASKGGLIAMTYSLARKLAKYGITVNVVAPGTIQSTMSESLIALSKGNLLSNFPLNRLGNASEVAAAVCYFASIESDFTTGAVLDVNGGMFMG